MKKIKVGPSFSDYIYTGDQFKHQKSKVKGYVDYLSSKELHLRGFLIPLILFVGAIVLIGRLFYLQVMQGDYYRVISDSNRTRTTIVHAPRGIIFDRNGVPLVFNTPGFRKTINGKTTLFDQKEAVGMLAKGDTTLEIDSLRSYPYKDMTSHVIGYVGQISPDELQTDMFHTYQPTDVIGKMGIEQYYENLLKGIDGEKLIEVDATGKIVRTLGQTDPVPGQNITLTLDINLQKAAYDGTKDVKKGAVIVSKPDGEILAMVSRPSFDPNIFTMGTHYTPDASDPYQHVDQILLDNDNQPLLNRAIAGEYPPGSTFKLITAISGLETNTIDKNFTVEDEGILKIGSFSFSNWYYSQYGKTEGQVNIVKAIQRSNDIFFYKLGDMLGVDTISATAKKFGVGQKLGIDLLGEKSGLLPTKEWKKEVMHDNWYLGDNYHYGIGQGYLLTTPLQVNAWTQAIANAGMLYQPHLLENQQPKVINKGLLNQENFDLVREGMIEACQPGGVAWPLFDYSVKNAALRNKIDGKDFVMPSASSAAALSPDSVGVSIACKTGTAQHGDDQTLPHAWVTLFAPAYHPQIVVTVLVESSGEGSNVAAPIAKKILDAYFSNLH